ncbi:MAG: hypothetical protein ACTSU7_00090 [Candidatus Heimdallarchaeaceae archaeon]
MITKTTETLFEEIDDRFDELEARVKVIENNLCDIEDTLSNLTVENFEMNKTLEAKKI